MREVVEWRNASPLWPLALHDTQPGTRLRQPSLLRFASDEFMDELTELLATAPDQLADKLLRNETWRDTLADPDSAAGWYAEGDLPNPPTVPKLFQPIHGRFYLLAAALVCRRPGLPDHRVDTAKDEKVFAVVRRVVDGGEQAWVADQGWVDVANTAKTVAGEESLPLFPLYFAEDGRPRRLFGALIPTAGRATESMDATESTRRLSDLMKQTPDGQLSPEDPRPGMFATRIGGPLDQVLAAVNTDPKALVPLATLKAESGWQERPQPIVEISRFWLLDLGEYLRDHVDAVWKNVIGDAEAPDLIEDSAEAAIYRLLTDTNVAEDGVAQSLETALAHIADLADELLALGEPAHADAARYDISTLSDAAFHTHMLDALKLLFARADQRTLPTPQVADPPRVDRNDPDLAPDGSHYVLRCVYRRPQCIDGECEIVSAPSMAYRYAGFFDEDAPARSINISLPKDTGIGALRRFQRGVSIAVSSKMRNQMERIRGVTMGKVDDGKLGQEGNLSFGMVCSLSIPIVTIVALILLMIMVQLLNIIFWWLPFLKVCLPRVK